VLAALLRHSYAQAQALLARVQGLHLELFFDQHSLDVLASCVYAVARVAGLRLSFRSITRTIQGMFPLQLPHLFGDADIGMAPSPGVLPALDHFGSISWYAMSVPTHLDD
jgi:hypothetical protein